MSRPKFWAVLPAAGIGRRMGRKKPKQYLQLAGRTMLEHSLAPFCEHPLIAGIVVVVAPQDEYWPTLEAAAHARIMTAPGGRERRHSVLNGLERLQETASPNDWVLVHDAARPCVTGADLERLLTAAADHSVGGILAAPINDTVKQAGAECEIQATLPRERLWRALTPQMFRLGLLRDALAVAVAGELTVTDEAQALENQGYRPLLVPGGAHNIKASHAEDLPLAEFYLSQRERKAK